MTKRKCPNCERLSRLLVVNEEIRKAQSAALKVATEQLERAKKRIIELDEKNQQS